MLSLKYVLSVGHMIGVFLWEHHQQQPGVAKPAYEYGDNGVYNGVMGYNGIQQCIYIVVYSGYNGYSMI